jgi:hypothetical protein
LLAIMIVKSRMVEETIYDYWVLGWQLTGPRNLAQAVTSLTTRNGPDLNLGPVIVNRKVVPSHATKTCRGSTSTAALILNLCARLVNFTPRPPYPTNYPDKLFTVSFRRQANVEILYIQRPLPFRSLNSSVGIETKLRNVWSRVRVPAGAGSKTYRLSLGPTQLFLRGLEWPRREADHFRLVPRLSMSGAVPPLTPYTRGI